MSISPLEFAYAARSRNEAAISENVEYVNELSGLLSDAKAQSLILADEANAIAQIITILENVQSK